MCVNVLTRIFFVCVCVWGGGVLLTLLLAWQAAYQMLEMRVSRLENELAALLTKLRTV